MFNKISILSIVGLAFWTTASVAEAKVCLAVAQDDCDITIVGNVEKPIDSDLTFHCPSRFNLNDVMQPQDENHVCTCEACTDDAGTHYDCKCTEKDAECTDTCAAHEWVEECSAGCTSTPFKAPDNPAVTATKTECAYMGKICGKDCYQKKEVTGDGWWGSFCCGDNDCKSSSELPLYCINGKCLECGGKADCSVTGTRYKLKHGIGGFYRGASGDAGPYRTPKQTYEWADTRYKSKFSCCDGECVADYCKWCRETHGASAKCSE